MTTQSKMKQLTVGDVRTKGDFYQLQDTRRVRYGAGIFANSEVPGPVRPVRMGFGIPLIPADLLATNWFRPI